MCSYHTLYHDDSTGYVIHCTECDHIQFGFGNVLITFIRADFYAFTRWINNICNDYDHHNASPVKCITVPTPCDGLKMLLSSAELQLLDRLLDQAETELKSADMLRLFKV